MAWLHAHHDAYHGVHHPTAGFALFTRRDGAHLPTFYSYFPFIPCKDGRRGCCAGLAGPAHHDAYHACILSCSWVRDAMWADRGVARPTHIKPTLGAPKGHPMWHDRDEGGPSHDHFQNPSGKFTNVRGAYFREFEQCGHWRIALFALVNSANH